MSRVKLGYKDTKVKEIIYHETGEIIDVHSLGLLERKRADYDIYNSDFYFFFDTDQLFNLLANGIRQVDLALLVSISSNLMLGSNICMINDYEPHNTESIAELIGSTSQSAKIKINRLIEIGVLHHGIMKEHKRLGRVYIINPYVIRKGHRMKPSLKTIFNKIE